MPTDGVGGRDLLPASVPQKDTGPKSMGRFKKPNSQVYSEVLNFQNILTVGSSWETQASDDSESHSGSQAGMIRSGVSRGGAGRCRIHPKKCCMVGRGHGGGI